MGQTLSRRRKTSCATTEEPSSVSIRDKVNAVSTTAPEPYPTASFFSSRAYRMFKKEYPSKEPNKRDILHWNALNEYLAKHELCAARAAENGVFDNYPAPQVFLSYNRETERSTNKKTVHLKRKLEKLGYLRWNRSYWHWPEGEDIDENGNKKKGLCQRYTLNWEKISELDKDIIYRKEDEELKGLKLPKTALNALEYVVNTDYIKGKMRGISVKGGQILVSGKYALDVKSLIIRFYGYEGTKEYPMSIVQIEKVLKEGTSIYMYGEHYFAFRRQKEEERWIKDRVFQTRNAWRYQASQNYKPRIIVDWDESSNKRQYTTVTNLPKELRKKLLWDEEKTSQIDIKNSQLVMLSKVLREGKLGEYDVSRAIYVSGLNFSELVSSGKFYEYIMEKGNLPDRLTAKLYTFRVLFDRRRNNPANKLFDKCFPYEMPFINTFKEQRGYEQLAILLQVTEAGSMRKVQGNIRNRGFKCTGIHDSILCKQSEVNEIHKIMMDTLSEEGIQCQVEFE